MRIERYMSRCVLENCEENVVEHALSIVELTITNDVIKSYKIYPFERESESVEYCDNTLLVKTSGGIISFHEIF